MKYFLDTEFIENGQTIDLISIGIVAEPCGEQTEPRTLYLQNAECRFEEASEWVWRNVYPHLAHFQMRGGRSCAGIKNYDSGILASTTTGCGGDGTRPCPWATRSEIRAAVFKFCSVEKYGKPEFWGYFADYDWVAFCQLFGRMTALPKGFPMYCRDIKQWADMLGDVRIPKPEVEIHHALEDALWVRSAHDFLTKKAKINEAVPMPPSNL